MDDRERASIVASNVLFAYAAFLVVCGVSGFAMAGFEAKAKTSLIMGLGGGFLFGVCSGAARAQSSKVKAIGVHIALLALFVFGGVFVWRASLIYGIVAKTYLFYLLSLMAVVSFLTLGLLIAYKPKPKKTA